MLDDEELDRTDADHVETTVSSHGYRLLKARLMEVHNAHSASLRRRSGEEETSYERGFLDALDVVISLPRILIDETKMPMKGPKGPMPHKGKH